MGALFSPQRDSCITSSFCVFCALYIKGHLIHNKGKGKLLSFVCPVLSCPQRTPPFPILSELKKKTFFSYLSELPLLIILYNSISICKCVVLSNSFSQVILIYNFMSDHKLCHQLRALGDDNLAIKTFLSIGRPSINLSNNICCIFNGKIQAIIRL